MRIKFPRGEQRKFLDLVVEKTNSPSLRGLIQFGLKVPYSTLKNYYNETRSLPEELFVNLCRIAGVEKSDFEFEILENNWGKVKGGLN